MSRICLWRCLATVEEGCEEEAQKEKVEKKRRKRRTVEKEESGMKSLKKLLRASRREKASAHEDANSTAQKAAGQSVKQNWDCSQIETEEEEEEEDWQKEDQMCNGLNMTSWRRFWNEEEWEELLCRRMSCKRYLIEGKKARGTEEMIKWRSMSQEEMDQSTFS